jgi:hypothetical protein
MAAARARTPTTAPARAKPRSDVYVGLLILALLAQVAGAAFLYLDYQQYPDAKPPQVQKGPKGGGPGPGGPVQPAGIGGGPPPGGMAGQGGGPPPGGMAGMAGGVPPAGMGGNPPPAGMAGMGGNPPGAMMGKAPGP